MYHRRSYFSGAAVVVILKVMNTDPLSSLFQNAKDAVIGEEGIVTTISKSSLEEVFEISELATLECYYHNVAKSTKTKGTGLTHVGEKERKFWIE